MNLALSDEQVFLREAARGALSRFKTLEAAREALDGDDQALPDLWPTACEAGWPGLLIGEEHGGAGLGAFDAMLVARRVRPRDRRRADPRPPARHGDPRRGFQAPMLAELATGEKRAAYLPASPPSDLSEEWSVDSASGAGRPSAPTAVPGEGGQARVSGKLAFVPDAPGADLLVGVALPAPTPEGLVGKPVGVVIESGADGVSIEQVSRYDSTRSLGHVTLTDAPATVLDTSVEDLAAAWYLAQALIAAESLGSVETCTRRIRGLRQGALHIRSRDRLLPGRQARADRGPTPAGERPLVAVLRRLGPQRQPAEFPLAASAARSVAGNASDHAARAMISVHGGIGATWEHDAPLYFRRAQLSRRLLGGTGASTDRVAGELIAQAEAVAA